MMLRGLLIAAASLLLVAAGPQEVAGEVAGKIMSPFCPGVTLHDCPSAEADELRREIVTLAETGMGADEIIDALEADYGPLRATPENPLARLVPWVLAAGGIAAAWLLMSRFASRPSSGTPLEVTPEERARIETELAAFREET